LNVEPPSWRPYAGWGAFDVAPGFNPACAALKGRYKCLHLCATLKGNRLRQPLADTNLRDDARRLSHSGEAMGAGMGLTSELAFVPQLCKLVPRQLQVDLLDLRRERISAVFNKAGNLRVPFQNRPKGLDLSLGLRERLPGHQRANLFPQCLEESLLVI
jgi:hypothetical protein